jgi:hypothetical protein
MPTEYAMVNFPFNRGSTISVLRLMQAIIRQAPEAEKRLPFASRGSWQDRPAEDPALQ